MPPRKPLQSISKLPKSLREPIWVDPYKVSIISVDGFLDVDDQGIQKQIKAEVDYVHEKKLEKFKELQDFYDIHPDTADGWEKFALRIACEFIPGFRMDRTESKGRKKSWSNSLLYALWYEVQEKMKKKSSAYNACRILAKQSPWRDLIRSSTAGEGNTKTLYEWYRKARMNPLVKGINDACGDIPDIDGKNEVTKTLYESMRKRAFEGMAEKKKVTTK